MNYDTVIVGAGSAGCVLANRLSADSNRSVLLLEAGGPDKKMEVSTPAAFSKLFKTDSDWAYHTVAQPNCGGREMFWPRGKMVGGSSSMNAMIVQRGSPADYDEWATLGNEEWAWEDVLPYFKKIETYTVGHGKAELHGQDGPMNVTSIQTRNPLSKVFVEAAKATTSLPENRDFNDGEQTGWGYYDVNQKGGKRWSSATAYLKPALNRTNLTAITRAAVTKINFEGTRCTGVTYSKDGKLETVSAGEVILCGGAINSPHLLLLSGIGPSAHLADHGIEVVADIPGVGQNLIDHPAIGVSFYCTQPITLYNASKITQLIKYLVTRKGMLSSNIAESGGFIAVLPDADRPDLQFHFAPAFFVEHGSVDPEAHGFSIGPTLVKPKSVGEIKLRSNNPLDHPLIDPNYLSHPDDMTILREGIKLARRIGMSESFDPYRGDEFLPGAEVQSDEEIDNFVREKVETLYHPVGTCKMGLDPMAVVNPALQVHGVTGLRVADASVMPTIPNANTHFPTLMIGEKAADMIINS